MSGDAYLAAAAAAFKFGFIHEGAQVGWRDGWKGQQRCLNTEAGEVECQNSRENLPEPGPK